MWWPDWLTATRVFAVWGLAGFVVLCGLFLGWLDSLDDSVAHSRKPESDPPRWRPYDMLRPWDSESAGCRWLYRPRPSPRPRWGTRSDTGRGGCRAQGA